jgi:hypothetical protein
MLMAADDTFVRGDKISRNEWRTFQNQKPFVHPNESLQADD